MKRILSNLFWFLAACSAFNLQFSSAVGQSVTFTNPTPAPTDWFGYALTAVGTDRVLISAHYDDTNGLQAGAVYLFNTNGTLLTTFSNPTPAPSDYFGISLTAVGSDRVLIGAYEADAGVKDAGGAYLFDTNGVW